MKLADALSEIGVGVIGNYDCKRELVNEALKVIKHVHSYEEPLINIIPLANHVFDTGK